jgi:hypothetical protein
MLQGKFVFDRRDELGLTGRSLEGGSVSLMSALKLLPEVREILDDYKVNVRV